MILDQSFCHSPGKPCAKSYPENCRDLFRQSPGVKTDLNAPKQNKTQHKSPPTYTFVTYTPTHQLYTSNVLLNQFLQKGRLFLLKIYLCVSCGIHSCEISIWESYLYCHSFIRKALMYFIQTYYFFARTVGQLN